MVAWNERMNRATLNRFTEERSEGSVMKSLRSRLEALEVAARYVSGANQLDILLAARLVPISTCRMKSEHRPAHSPSRHYSAHGNAS